MLDDRNATIASERSTGREPLTDDDVGALLAEARRVQIARGKSLRELDPKETRLDDLKGPTGNYRAPILLVDGTLLVGFSADALANLL